MEFDELDEEAGFERLAAMRRRRRWASFRKLLAAAALGTLAAGMWGWGPLAGVPGLAWPSELRAMVQSWLAGGPALPPPPAPLEPAPAGAPEPAPPPEPAPLAEAPPPETPLPSLDESDALLRELVAWVSSHPALLSWILTEDLVRRATAAVSNVALGESPRKQVPFLAPEAGFRARDRGGRPVVDPRSYARYDLAADVFASLDAEGCAALYRRSRPLFLEAHSELGHARGFEETLAQAFSELLATPLVAGDIGLVPDTLGYEYEDGRLEALSDAQKHLLRMGPDNALKVKRKLREIAAALSLAPIAGAAPRPPRAS